MPCVNISTNVNLEGIDTNPIFTQVTKTVASIIGRPENLVMVVLKGSVPIHFEFNKEPAAYTEIISMGGINKEVKRKLIDDVGSILQSKLSIPKTRFFCKVYDTTLKYPSPKL